ncbi:MAG: NAD(FAD)-utilizing dehydrogenase [Anaerovoracaceae bacterium]
MYRIHQIKLDIGESWNVIPERIKRKVKNSNLNITSWEVVKESIDARDKGDLKLVYSVDFECDEEIQCDKAPQMDYIPVECNLDKSVRPVVIGFGPSGIFAALTLAQMGYRPIVLERGKAVGERYADVQKFWKEGVLNPESNVQFGEGGAGTFSDGKLTTGIKDYRMRKVAVEFVNFGAQEEILYKQKPHIGTDVLKTVVSNMRKEIIKLGGEVRFGAKVTNMEVVDNKVKSLEINGQETLECSQVILAIGHSARDTFEMLLKTGLEMEQKPFSIGLRIEHPQEVINVSQYGRSAQASKLGPADYKLSYHTKKDKRGVYTFCMCPGGEVINASSEEGYLVTNGMSNSKRDSGIANSAILCDVRPEDFESNHPLAGVEFQRKYEKLAFEASKGKYQIPKSSYRDFEASRLAKCLPKFALEAILEAMPVFGRKIRGFNDNKSVLKGIESRSSSPVRLVRDRSFNSSIEGLYPVGEGAGYAGGIVSAAVDGIKVAERVILGQ